MIIETATTTNTVTFCGFGTTDQREMIRAAVLRPWATADSVGRVCFGLGIPIRRAWPWIFDAIRELNRKRGRYA